MTRQAEKGKNISRAVSAPSGVQVDLVEVRGRFALNHPDVAHF
jgi:hypothetical protein